MNNDFSRKLPEKQK